jgi:DnaK suppressor protein
MELDRSDWPDWEQLLRARRVELSALVGDLGRDEDGLIAASRDSNLDDEHDPEGATIAFERSQLNTLSSRGRLEIAEIDQALARLADGRFGRCESCGGDIGSDRLAARPAARHCVACAARAGAT